VSSGQKILLTTNH